MAEVNMLRVKVGKNALRAASLIVLGALTACASSGGSTLNDLFPVDAASGSTENISSLTAVIDRSPNDPGAYNVRGAAYGRAGRYKEAYIIRSEEHTSELQSRENLVCSLLLEKKKMNQFQ